MASLFGFYSLVLGFCLSFLIIFLSVKNFRNTNIFDNKLISFTFLQFFFVIVSFLGFYKITGTWGNHEGSLLLWLLVLTLFVFLFLLESKEQKKKI